MRIICFLLLMVLGACHFEEASNQLLTEENEPRLVSAARDSLARQPQAGDLIFHSSQTWQSQAIQLATQSRYSHVGLLWQQDQQWYVFEAVQPVKLTPLKEWIQRGKDQHFIIKSHQAVARKLKDPKLLSELKNWGKAQLGKNYDLHFNWSDQQMYCSELVWKCYKEVLDIELCPLKQFKDYQLDHPLIKNQLEKRYGKKLPLNEKVVSPGDLFQAKNLLTLSAQKSNLFK